MLDWWAHDELQADNLSKKLQAQAWYWKGLSFAAWTGKPAREVFEAQALILLQSFTMAWKWARKGGNYVADWAHNVGILAHWAYLAGAEEALSSFWLLGVQRALVTEREMGGMLLVTMETALGRLDRPVPDDDDDDEDGVDGDLHEDGDGDDDDTDAE